MSFNKDDANGYVTSMERMLKNFDSYFNSSSFSFLYLCRHHSSCENCIFLHEKDCILLRENEERECGLLVPSVKIDYIVRGFCEGVRDRDYFKAVCHYELFKIEVEVLSGLRE